MSRILTSTGDEAVLTGLAHPNAELEIVFLKVRRAVDDLLT